MGKLWRVKRGGKFIGSFRVTIKGREINLGTKDATEALRRAKLAARGLWPQEENAAAAVAAAFSNDSEISQDATPVTVPAGSGAAAAGPVDAEPSPRPSIGGEGAPLIPEVVKPAQNWAADAGAAAAEDSPAGAASDAAPQPLNIGGLDLSGLIDTAAGLAVDLQLQLQAYGIRRGFVRQAGEVPQDNALRQVGVEMWRQQFKIWIPTDVPLPPWAAALLVTGVCGFQQYATSTPIPKDGAQASAT